jgi:hypothetical protein
MAKLKKAALVTAVAASALTSLVLTAPAANADSRGCNGAGAGYCVWVEGSGNHVNRVVAGGTSLSGILSFTGHYRIFGPDFSVNTQEKEWKWYERPYVSRNQDYSSGSKFCMEQWSSNGSGGWNLLSRPCVSTPV